MRKKQKLTQGNRTKQTNKWKRSQEKAQKTDINVETHWFAHSGSY